MDSRTQHGLRRDLPGSAHAGSEIVRLKVAVLAQHVVQRVVDDLIGRRVNECRYLAASSAVEGVMCSNFIIVIIRICTHLVFAISFAGGRVVRTDVVPHPVRLLLAFLNPLTGHVPESVNGKSLRKGIETR